MNNVPTSPRTNGSAILKSSVLKQDKHFRQLWKHDGSSNPQRVDRKLAKKEVNIQSVNAWAKYPLTSISYRTLLPPFSPHFTAKFK